MKKMMLLAELLVLGTMGYAAGTSGDTATATFEAKVNVVKKLTVTPKNTVVDFGTVAAETNGNNAKTEASFTITGAVNKNIKISFKDSSEGAWNGTFDFQNEKLKGNATLSNGLKANEENVVSLGENGTYTFEIGGTLDVGDVAEDTYTSEPITVNITYNDLN